MRKMFGSAFAGFIVASLMSANAQVVINEFQYDDSGVDNREYFELYNAGSTAVDISGWVLESGDSTTNPDNNPDYTIPGGTVLQPGQFYVIGSPLVPNVNLVVTHPNTGLSQDLWENDQEWTALKDASGNVIDAIAYETNKINPIPAEILPQIGTGIWGNYTSIDGDSAGTDTTDQSISRYIDGRDTNNNGRDFGLLPRTPGYSNMVAPPVFPVIENFDAQFEGETIANWTGSFRNPRVIDPIFLSIFNPNALSNPSPQGGNALIGWDWAGGGNQAGTNYIFDGKGGYELYVYIDANLRSGTETESWAVGIMGSAESFYNTPYIGTAPNACGITGVAWVYFRSATQGYIRLVDAKDGGDSRDSSPYWATLGEIQLSSISSGWYRLRLEVDGNKVKGTFGGTYGSLGDGMQFCGTTESNLGTMYMGYRELIVDNSTTRPITVDNVKTFLPVTGDANGDGCVNDEDLLTVLFNFGGDDCNADLNGDGVVNDEDLLLVLFNFGNGC